MESQTTNNASAQLIDALAPQQWPLAVAKQIAESDVIVLIDQTTEGPLIMQPLVRGREYSPGTIKAHAYVDALYREHENILRRVNGVPTDSMRYLALRDFAVLGTTDKARFEVVSDMLQQFEESGSIPAEDKRTAADFEKMANFLVQAMFETEPKTPVAPD